MDVKDTLREMARIMAEVDGDEGGDAGLDSFRDHIVAYGQDAVPELEELLSDPETEVAYQAARVLERLGDAGFERAMGYYLAHLNDRDRGGEPLALGRVVDLGERVLPFVNARLDASTPFGERHAAVLLLADVGGSEAMPKLEALTADPDYRIAQAAAEAFGHVGGPRALATLLQLLGHAHPNVRFGALCALDLAADSAVVERLVDLIASERATTASSTVTVWWASPVAGPVTVADRAEALVQSLTGEEFDGDLGRMRAWVEAHREEQ